MILTVTPNTALDVTYTVDRLVPDEVHRVADVRRRAGGKGVNVARVLHALGADTRAIALAGGAAGRSAAQELAASGVPAELVPIAGETRLTTTVLSAADRSVTLFNEPGPEITAGEWAALAAAVARHRPEVLVLSGSLPPGAPPDGYARLAASGVPTVLDTSGEALLAGLAGKPAVVKPNARELVEVTGIHDVETAAGELRGAGAGAVVVSLGPEGMLAVTASGTWHAAPAAVLSGNSTGAGDAAVAGIALGIRHGEDWPRLLGRAVALSGAAVLGPLAGDVDLPHYHREHDRVAVRARQS
ncbi:1-phosphofructokinase family hexose kinase [Amycolatopsis sp. PS_44_ISF1]|uniref:1-phosphofructokinase family hexose kinase n=1 Tax=Amycolatopsis sp. PS_44_ISF1 TaxID=2974917 RepID=UPI0028DEEBB3|nr:1-phosphofructokinase family hexose kinase [Amycolatopsis sp. PS_44_ISF1]MDT8913270.1 1-phosphofructokinase family hexose kinase [Amycolatopsis sp. PS_44_ISF1]